MRARIGLVSDTHMPNRLAELPRSLFRVLDGCDLLLHAGDLGELWVLDRLSAIAPLIAVHGNDDTEGAQRELPYQQVIAVMGQRILLYHSHLPDHAAEMASRASDDWEPKLARRSEKGRQAGASIVVYGHSHIPMAREHDGVLLVNPGALASGNPVTRQLLRTVALLFFRDDGACFVAHVDLAEEAAFVPEVDWRAGFMAAAKSYSGSILEPELRYRWDEVIAHTVPVAPDAFWQAVTRAAHRCWAGEQEFITLVDLLGELRSDQTLSQHTRRTIERSLAQVMRRGEPTRDWS